MFAVEVYAAVRAFVFIDGHPRREAARVFGLSRETVTKMCRFSLPPGYTRSKPAEKPKLGTLLPVIALYRPRPGTRSRSALQAAMPPRWALRMAGKFYGMAAPPAPSALLWR